MAAWAIARGDGLNPTGKTSDDSNVAQIIWRDAQGVEGTLELGADEVTIGRALECAIRTEDALVSRVHARIFLRGRQYVVEDLGSANGVFVDERQVTAHALSHGDAVRCGSLWLRFVERKAAKPTGEAGRAHVPVPEPKPAVANSAEAPNVRVAPGHNAEAEAEIRSLRRRIEQMQSELNVLRATKWGDDDARRMEDLDRDLLAAQTERDAAQAKLAVAENSLRTEGANVKFRRAMELAEHARELAQDLADAVSAARIESMAAEQEFEQFADALPRASFELIRQALKDTGMGLDRAKELLRDLRQTAGELK